MVTPWDKPLYWSLGDLSIKTHGGERPSVVASWIGRPVLDEVLPPSDRGERSETFSLRRRGVPQGDCQGVPPKTPRTPAALRQVSFLGGAAP